MKPETGNFIHHTELTPVPDGHPLARESVAYRREVGRMLAEGREGQWVLIRGDDVIGYFAAQSEVHDEGRRRFGAGTFLVRQVREYEPVYRLPMRVMVANAVARGAQPADRGA